jgi:hypothetical protein
VRPYFYLVVAGAGLVTLAGWLGGRGAVWGGTAAVAAQLLALLLLRPVMQATPRLFITRWLGGMGVRALVLGMLLVVAATRPGVLPLLPSTLGYLGVLLPLLFTEIWFLK